MHRLGQTRSSFKRDHLLQTADTFVRTSLPCLHGAEAIVHISPAAGARFAQSTVEFRPGGTMRSAGAQRFVYVLDGQLVLHIAGERHALGPARFAYLPSTIEHYFEAASSARMAMIERPRAKEVEPAFLVGHETDRAATALMGDEDLEVRTLLPDTLGLDFAVNTMTYQPGASLSMVEIHVMEHGLLMLEGGGIYRLGDDWYPVEAGDFIWMGPFCPQWFGALGKRPAKYLIYKDWNRHPIGEALVG